MGHWSTLGFYKDENILALDTGCLWGGKLTAARIDSDEITIVSVDCSRKEEEVVEKHILPDTPQI
jgi:bis(5'-nucleosyl)-tetraphosphatase (symmetrical)